MTMPSNTPRDVIQAAAVSSDYYSASDSASLKEEPSGVMGERWSQDTAVKMEKPRRRSAGTKGALPSEDAKEVRVSRAKLPLDCSLYPRPSF
jgi:hypothetical protein